MKIMQHLGINVLILSALNFCYPAVTYAQSKIEATMIQQLYDNAKATYSLYEKKHGGFITTKNTQMHYLSWGNSNKTTLIWAHGSLTNGYELLGIVDTLVQQGYRVIAIDYYGHGKTPIPKHPVSLYHVADDIKELMDELKIEKAVIGGWSRGAAVSTAFYDEYPERVLGIILEDGGSVSINTDYHLMGTSTLESAVRDIVSSFPNDTIYQSEFDAYKAIYDWEMGGSQFQNLAWIAKTEEGGYGICPGVVELFNMKSKSGWLNNILRPTQSPLFAESFSILEPKIIYRNLNVPAHSRSGELQRHNEV